MRRLPGNRATADRSPPGAGSTLTRLLGGREPRYNRMLDKLNGDSVVFRVPKDFGADEHNVVLGLGRQPIAAGAQFTFTANAPRDCILRDLVIDETSLAVGAVGSQDAVILAMTVEGNALTLGNGAAVGTFGRTNTARPEFDLPVAGGTPVSITIANTSAVALTFCPTFSID